MNQLVAVDRDRTTAVSTAEAQTETLVTFFLGKQMFGLPVLKARDILTPQRIFSIPLAPGQVAGSINLRGRVVTVIDMRRRLGLPDRPPESTGEARRLCITVEHRGELYGLLVDRIGDVLALSRRSYEDNPGTLDPRWRELCLGVYRLDGSLLVLLDLDRFLDVEA